MCDSGEVEDVDHFLMAELNLERDGKHYWMS